VGRDFTACGSSARASASACRSSLAASRRARGWRVRMEMRGTGSKAIRSPRTWTHFTSVKAGWLNITLTNYRNTDAPGRSGSSKKHLIASPMCPRPFSESGLPCLFLTPIFCFRSREDFLPSGLGDFEVSKRLCAVQGRQLFALRFILIVPSRWEILDRGRCYVSPACFLDSGDGLHFLSLCAL